MTKQRTGAAIFILLAITAGLAASGTTVTGTVVTVDRQHLEARAVDAAGKPATKPDWFAVTGQTRVFRGTTAVAFTAAKIRSGERVTILVAEGDEASSDYTCVMHPSVARDVAGPCPICGMAMKARVRPAKAAEIRLEGE